MGKERGTKVRARFQNRLASESLRQKMDAKGGSGLIMATTEEARFSSSR
jgi:hypothetical protein